jgi:putative nucleotidyltransferase with HDIG domain
MPDRWRHSVRVAIQASRWPCLFNQEAQTVLQTAAILHDIGYSTDIVRSAFHAVDGAVFLRSQGVDEDVVSLVAHHSCAHIEANLRGLSRKLAWFPSHRNRNLQDAMIWCDMTSGPTGDEVDIDWRLADIRARYGPESIGGRFADQAEPHLRAATSRVQERRRRAIKLRRL